MKSKSVLAAAMLAACFGLASAAGAAESQPGRQARVATGAKVALVASSKTAAQWTVRRPHVREMRPKVRGTFD